jgi:ribonuclease HI
MKIECYIDGSCEPRNPGGRMGIGVSIEIDGKKHDYSESYEPSPQNSNNVAEYLGLEYVLKFIKNKGFENCEIVIKSDSQLLINQASGDWKIKRGLYVDHAKACRKEVINLSSANNIDFKFEWIPREQNEYADNLSKL